MDRKTLLVDAALILAILCVFGQVLGFGFVRIDDFTYVADNPHVRTGLSWSSLAWAFTSTEASNWHPLTWISLMIDAELGGHGPRWFHLTNVALHATSTLLLFHGLLRLTGFTGRSAFVAALFAVHPLHVESVAWVAERKDVLSTVFWLLTLVAYARYVGRPGSARYALVLVCFVLGLLSKPMLVTLPLVLIVLDFWPLGRLPAKRGVNSPYLDKLPLLVLSAASCVMTLRAQSGTLRSLEILPLWTRIENAAVSYAAYLAKMFWPSGLAVDYPYRSPIPVALWVASALFVVAVTVFALRNARRKPHLAVGWLWYLITLVPVIGIVQVGSQSMADRYTYVPLIGPFVMIAWEVPDRLAAWVSGKGERLRLLTGTAVAILLLLAWRAHVQTGYWRDTVALLTHTVTVTERHARAHTILASELTATGKLDQAIAHYGEALRIEPDSVVARVNLAGCLGRQGRLDEAAANYEEALRRSPDDPEILTNLGIVMTQQERLDEALVRFTAALDLAPDDPSAHRAIAVALGRLGRDEEAIQHLRRAVPAYPLDPDVRVNLGVLLRRQGKLDEAVAEFSEALRLDPGNLAARDQLARTEQLRQLR
jgi:tetratricopeptide (TPR) repeat protein